MNWYSILWAVILSAVVCVTFRCAWRWEHGGDPERIVSEKNGRETYILVPPTVLFWVLLAFALIAIWFRGLEGGFIAFAGLSIDVMILTSVYFVLLLIILPLLRSRISARACAVLWIVPALLTYQAHMLISTSAPLKTIYIPRNILTYIGIAWVIGFVGVSGYYLVSHLLFHKWVMENTEEETSEDVLALLENKKESLIYRRPVKLLRGDVATPFSMGRTKKSRTIVLPRKNYTEAEIDMIFSHELHHLQRCDVDTKVFLCLCNAACWFNPLVWIATKKAAEDLERSCDEIVTENMTDSERREYAALLLDSAGPSKGCTTCLSAAATTLRYRLNSVVNQKKRFLGTAVIVIAVFLCVLCFGRITVSDVRGRFSDLILTPEAKIERIIDQSLYADTADIDSAYIHSWDENALRRLFSNIEVSHVFSIMDRQRTSKSDFYTFILSDGQMVILYEYGGVIIESETRDGFRTDQYIITEGLDWNTLKSCF